MDEVIIMTYDEIKQKIDEHIKLIEIGKSGFAESNERASKFLIIQAILGDYLYDVDMEIVKLKTIKDASFCQAVSEVPMVDAAGVKLKTTVTEKKTLVNGNKVYTDNREACEQMEALQNWIKGYMKIFSDAHVHYRQMARSE